MCNEELVKETLKEVVKEFIKEKVQGKPKIVNGKILRPKGLINTKQENKK